MRLAEVWGCPTHVPVRVTRAHVWMSPSTGDAEAWSYQKLSRSYFSLLYMSSSHEDLEGFLDFPSLVLNLVTWHETVRHKVN